MHCICYRVAFGSYESLAHRSRFALTLASETEPKARQIEVRPYRPGREDDIIRDQLLQSRPPSES
jgi:hypothetical protein